MTLRCLTSLLVPTLGLTLSAAADVRRELAASRQMELPRKKKKKPLSPAAPAP